MTHAEVRKRNAEIRRLAATGKYTRHELAEKFGVDYRTVQSLLYGKPCKSGHNPRLHNPRLGEIRRLRTEGKTLEEIGAKVGLTRERVRQLTIDIPAPRSNLPRHLKANGNKWYGRWRIARAKFGLSGGFERWEAFADWARFRDPGRLVPLDPRKPISPGNVRITEYLGRLCEAFGEWKTMEEWAGDKRCRVQYYCFMLRVRHYGWPVETALTAPENSMYGGFPVSTQKSA